MKEYKEIPGYEGYMVNEHGEVISMKRFPNKVMATSHSRLGYKTTVLCIDGKLKTCYVARLVLSAFVPYPAEPHLCVARNIDGNLDNCELSNLEWIVCETTDEYDPDKSLRKGVLKPDFTKEKMHEAKLKQDKKTIRKAALKRSETCRKRNEQKGGEKN